MKSFYSKDFRLGILGGGQLGRMFIQEAINYDVKVSVLDPSPDAPCSAIAHEFVCGDFNDFQTVLEFGRRMDVITIEIEHVNVEALEVLEAEGKKVFPQPANLRMVKDKGLQKQFYQQHEIATSGFQLFPDRKHILDANLSFPFVQKMRTGGYDGKGVQVIGNPSRAADLFDVPSVIEEMIDLEKEISVIIARNESGEVKTFPLVEMEFNPEANLVEFLFSPAAVTEEIRHEAISLAERIAEMTKFVGILAVEMFVDKNGKVLVNEIAPRPHNSGHHTIEACTTSQYEQHMRAILGLPLGDTELIQAAVMVNLLGEKGYSGPVKYEGLPEVIRWPGVHVHLYGKSETKPFRKMGHATITAEKLEDAKSRARQVMGIVKVLCE